MAFGRARGERRRSKRRLQAEVKVLRQLLPPVAFQGATMPSPYVDRADVEQQHGRELVPAGGQGVAESPFGELADVISPTRRVPWRRDPTGTVYDTTVSETSFIPWRVNPSAYSLITESIEGVMKNAPQRQGYLADIPIGGANENNQGYTLIAGHQDRRTLMEQMMMLYQSCPPVHMTVDVIARTCSAGAMRIMPDHEETEVEGEENGPQLSAQAMKAQDLFDYVNPRENFRQLMRGIFVDLQVYGDSFIEVVWAMGEPIALYSLPAPDMLIDADEHGDVNFYVQRTQTNRRAMFMPHQVIHIKMDSPRKSLYGMGPVEANVHPIVTWMFTEALLKATMKRGNPPNIGFKWDINASPADIKKSDQEYRTKNIGPENVGNPINIKGRDTDLKELLQNKIAEYVEVLDRQRDMIVSGLGAYPAKVGIIETGNLGGGTGTTQDKSMKINTCVPLQELVMEAFTFAILYQGFGIDDHKCSFEDVDWRDDETIEKIRVMRVERAGWTVNRYAKDIGEPSRGPAGDVPMIIQTRDVIPLADVEAMSQAAIAGKTLPPPGDPTEPGGGGAPTPSGGPGKGDSKPPVHARSKPTGESLDDIFEQFVPGYRERLEAALRELPGGDHGDSSDVDRQPTPA